MPRTKIDPTWAECLLRVQSVLADRLGNSAGDDKELVEAMRLLGLAERDIRRDLAAARKRVPPQAAQRGGTGVVEYRIETVRGEEMLAEYRAGNPEPYRCPKVIYLATAAVLKSASEPLTFAEIHKSVNQAVNEDQSDYRVRVSLRFWEAKRLIEHRRAKFSSRSRAASFAKSARESWHDTEAKPFKLGRSG